MPVSCLDEKLAKIAVEQKSEVMQTLLKVRMKPILILSAQSLMDPSLRLRTQFFVPKWSTSWQRLPFVTKPIALRVHVRATVGASS
jgi:hypothetical protein